jgi:signal transduction histidine kinase
MPEIPVAGFLLEALGAVAIALMLSSFERDRPRPGVREWSLGLWLRAFFLVAAIVIGRVGASALRTVVLAAAMLFAYWSSALILVGTWFRWNDREVRGTRRRLLAVLAVVAVATTFLEPLAGSWGRLLRSGTLSLAAAGANLVAGVSMLRGLAGGAGFGPRVLAAGLLGWAAEEALFLVIVAGGLGPVPDGRVLIEAELVLLLLTGVGMVAWLLEDERESAVKLQEALHRKEALSAMGTIVGGVAHEARNPLFGISATLDALAAGSRGDAALAPFLSTMREQVQKLSRLMTELLEYGRPIATELMPQSLSVAVARSIGSCSALAEEAGVKVELVGEPAGDVVPMDEPRLQQVFQNLVQNAIQHSPRSGRIRIELRPESDHDQPGVRCSVRDSGPGFAASDQERVFEPFFTHRRGGTGLGLSIVQRIVEQHAGRVTAANHPDGGGVVTVWLPANRAAAPPRTAARTGSEAPSRS